MITQDELQIVDSGSGYTIGELKYQHNHFYYLRPTSLVVLADGVDTLLNLVHDKMPKPKREGSSSETGGNSFNAFNTYGEAMDTFRNHPEKVVEFDPTELRIKDASEAGSIVDYDVVGDYIDMGRYLEGIPEAWGSMHNGNARNRRVNVVINLTQWGGLDHEVITHRGERLLRLIDALEAGGVRCRLTGVESTECGHTEVVIKQHQEALTVPDLAIVIHPEFLRRIMFRISEHSKTWQSGYGSALVFGEKVTSAVLGGEMNDELDIFVDSNMRNKHSIDSLFDKLERLLIWEMSKPVPEVSSVKLSDRGIYFEPNGYRSNDEIKREGNEVINDN